MSDILTKPVELAVLKKTLLKWLPDIVLATDAADATAETGSGATQVISIDVAQLHKIAVTAGEQAEILLNFMTQTRSDIDGLRVALTTQDVPACIRIAHRMKGSSRMVGAQDLAAACELMAHVTQQSNPAHAGTEINAAMARLEAHLALATHANQEQT